MAEPIDRRINLSSQAVCRTGWRGVASFRPWTKDKVGKASSDVIVRDPVVLTATLPRFLRTGDRGAVQLELDNVEGAAGDYNLAVAADGAAKLEGGEPQALKLASKQRDRVSVPVTASGAGPSTVTVKVSGPDNFALERSYALDVRPATQILTRRSVRMAVFRGRCDIRPVCLVAL